MKFKFKFINKMTVDKERGITTGDYRDRDGNGPVTVVLTLAMPNPFALVFSPLFYLFHYPLFTLCMLVLVLYFTQLST